MDLYNYRTDDAKTLKRIFPLTQPPSGTVHSLKGRVYSCDECIHLLYTILLKLNKIVTGKIFKSDGPL